MSEARSHDLKVEDYGSRDKLEVVNKFFCKQRYAPPFSNPGKMKNPDALFYQILNDKSRMEVESLSVKELRIKAELTQAQLAKKMNVDQSCVSLWESRKTRPAKKLHKKLARVLGCTINELFEEGES